MNSHHHSILVPAMTVLISMTGIADATGGGAARPSASREWLERPWEIRYVLFVEDESLMQAGVKVARRRNAERDKPGREKVYLDAEEMFEPTATFHVQGSNPLAAMLITFDPSGRVSLRNKRLSPFTAKRNLLGDLVFTRTASRAEQPYYFADWSQGIPGDTTFSPAVCAGFDSGRYDDGWDTDSYIGSFGCREWTAQLKQSELPFIDVTSYAPHGSFIGSFVGWSRFTDPTKPVIGLQGKTWLCLHDCPRGETPGVIPDIKAWLKRHDYPTPERPPRQPLYPNANYKDDLNE